MMKKLLLYLLLISCAANAQTNDLTAEGSEELFRVDSVYSATYSSKLDLNRDLKEQLLPIDSIIEIAKKNSAGIKMQDAIVQSGKSQVKYAKSEWLRDISFGFNNSYGNATYFYNTNETAAELQTQNLNTGYRAGININIPLYEFFGRQHRIDIYKHELEAKDQQKRNLEMELTRRVHYEYNYTLAAHRMMLIASESMQAALMHQAMADKEFREGVISVGESARITEFANKSRMEFETAKREFFNWYMQLETLVGVRMDTLLRKQ